MRLLEYPEEWIEVATANLYCILAKALDYNSSLCSWYTSNEQITHQFNRFALPITWDFAEAGILAETSGGFPALLNYTMRVISNLYSDDFAGLRRPTVVSQSATESLNNSFDAVITDPPYYDAIPYADLSDFLQYRKSNPVTEMGYHGHKLQPRGAHENPERIIL
jgi:putative DNA methylase